ncbi:MAG: ribosome rescue GTPase HflX, partial [Psychrobacter sp.]
HLPHELVESFHATLEETLEADLLLHVIDSSSEDMHEQISAVKEVLADIDNDVPVLNVYNKIDLTGEPARIGYANEGEPNRVYVSSKDNLGIEELTLAVQQLMTGTLTTFNLTLPYHAGHFKNTLYELGVILEESYDDSGHECLTIRLPSERLKQLLGEANLQPMEVLPLAQATLLMPILEPFEQNNEEDLQLSEDESLVAEDLTYEQIFETDNESSDHTAIDDNPSPQA